MFNYMVSIRLMTYNHAAFIKDAMDGIMMQKTSFPVEVVVGDDFSTDETLEIIRTYSNTDNITIKILDRPVGGTYWKKRQEKGRLYNFVDILNNCSGKYIALLDGDDYWTDPKKLQKQVDFLEANSEYTVCGAEWNVLLDKKIQDDSFLLERPNQILNEKDFITTNFSPIHTSTVLFRREKLIQDFLPKQELFEQMPVGDIPLLLLLTLNGKAFRLKDKVSVYRKDNDASITKQRRFIDIKDKLLKMLDYFDTWSAFKFHSKVKREKGFIEGVVRFQEKKISRFQLLFWLLKYRTYYSYSYRDVFYVVRHYNSK